MKVVKKNGNGPAPSEQDEIKGLIVSVLRDEYDCTNGGISSGVNTLLLVGDDIPKVHSRPRDSDRILKIVKRNIGGRVYIHAEPIHSPEKGFTPWSMGGNFVYSSDSRFREFVNDYPIAVHDRSDTWENYELLSR